MAETDDSSLRAASPQRKESLWKRSKKILDANQITFLQPLLKNSEGGYIFFFSFVVIFGLCWFRLFALFLSKDRVSVAARVDVLGCGLNALHILYFYSSLVKSLPLLGGRCHDR